MAGSSPAMTKKRKVDDARRPATANAIRASMRRARSIWSRRRHNLAKARRPESVTAAVDPPLSARQGSGLASRARTRPGGIIALSGATGAFDRPAPAFRVCPNRDAVGPLPNPGSKIQSAASLKGPVIATAAVASPPAPRRHSACNAAVFRAVFTPVLATFRKEMARRCRDHSEREAARGLALDHADGLGRCLDDQAASGYSGNFGEPEGGLPV
jgi:hypothetical protein